MSLGETIIVYGLGGYFMWQHPSVACVALIYLHARAALVCPACCLFLSVCTAIIPLDREIWVVLHLTRPCSGYCEGASSLCGCYYLSGGLVYLFPSYRSRGPQIHFLSSELWCEWWNSALLLEEEHWVFPMWKLHCWLCSVVSPVTSCAGSQNTLLLGLPLAPSQSCISEVALSLRHCFTRALAQIPEVRSWNCR